MKYKYQALLIGFFSLKLAATQITQSSCELFYDALLKSDLGTAHHIVSTMPINCRDDKGLTVLHILVKYGLNNSLLSSLYERGINLNAKAFDGTTPLMIATIHNNIAAMAWLHIYDNPLNSVGINDKNRAGQTALHIAVLANNGRAVQQLLNMGADPAIKDGFNRSTYDLALYLRHKEAQKALGVESLWENIDLD